MVRLFDLEAMLTSHTDDVIYRRDCLIVAGSAFAGIGAASMLWPFIQQMNPDASTKALASVEVDQSQVKEGQAIIAMWRGKPLFIRNRTKDEIESAAQVLISELPGGVSRNDAFPPGKPIPATDWKRAMA